MPLISKTVIMGYFWDKKVNNVFINNYNHTNRMTVMYNIASRSLLPSTVLYFCFCFFTALYHFCSSIFLSAALYFRFQLYISSSSSIFPGAAGHAVPVVHCECGDFPRPLAGRTGGPMSILAEKLRPSLPGYPAVSKEYGAPGSADVPGKFIQSVQKQHCCKDLSDIACIYGHIINERRITPMCLVSSYRVFISSIVV